MKHCERSAHISIGSTLSTPQSHWTGQVLTAVITPMSLCLALFRLSGINDCGHHLVLFRNPCTYNGQSVAVWSSHSTHRTATLAFSRQKTSSSRARSLQLVPQLTSNNPVTGKNYRRQEQEEKKHLVSPPPLPCNSTVLKINLSWLPQAWKENQESHIFCQSAKREKIKPKVKQ